MSVGYSLDTIVANKLANGRKIGVKLGRVCIDRDISVTAVAKRFKVSRQTIYNWYTGVYEPSKALTPRIRTYVDSLQA